MSDLLDFLARSPSPYHAAESVAAVLDEAGFRRQSIGERLAAVLLGPDPDTATRVAISLLSAGVHGCVTDPTIADLADAELQRVLLELTKKFLDVCVPTD